jgi:localization factor PodJL
MVPEAAWQLSATERLSGAADPLTDPRTEQRSVETLLRRLIDRVEENERRYSEALGELHGRLDRLSQAPAPLQTPASPDETESFERLRGQLSALAKRLEQPEIDPPLDEFAKFSKALAEARAVASGLTEEPLFNLPPSTFDLSAVNDAPFSFVLPSAEPSPAPSLSPPPVEDNEAELDQQLIDMAQRLERSLGEAMPANAIETLNQRMTEIAARFEAALEHSPKLEQLHQLERQIADMGQQLGRVEAQIAKVNGVESELQRLIQRCDAVPAQLENVASEAAHQAARLVADTGLAKPSAMERLDAIHRDLVAMNDRGRATDDRLADTLVAVHASLKDLVHQVERVKAPVPLIASAAAPAERGGETSPAAPQPQGRVELLLAQAERRAETQQIRDAEEVRLRSRLLRDRLGAAAATLENAEPATPFGRAKRTPLAEEAVDLDEVESHGSFGLRDAAPDPGADLIAAARRAAQAAAVRAEERGTSKSRRTRGWEGPSAPAGVELPERRPRSFLMMAAAFLLVVSAALLYSRLKSKPEQEASPTPIEQSAPAPTAATPPPAATDPAPSSTALPAPQPAPEPQAARAPEATARPILEDAPEGAPANGLEAAPEAAPEAGPGTAPAPAPDASQGTPPAGKSSDQDLPPPVRVSEVSAVVAAAFTTAGASDGAMPKPQLVSFGASDGGAHP